MEKKEKKAGDGLERGLFLSLTPSRTPAVFRSPAFSSVSTDRESLAQAIIYQTIESARKFFVWGSLCPAMYYTKCILKNKKNLNFDRIFMW